MANVSGKGGTCLINSVALILAGWDISKKANLPDATDSGTAAGYEAHVVGRKGAEITLRGWTNTSSPQPATLEPGTVLSTIHLTLDGTVKHVIASATVQSCRDGAKIDTGDTCDWEAVVKVNGSWTPLA